MKTIFAILSLMSFVVSTNAATIVVNGSFEDQATTGDGLGGLLGWNLVTTGVGTVTTVSSDSFFNTAPSDGSYMLKFNGNNGVMSINQDLTTVIGQEYLVTFDSGYSRLAVETGGVLVELNNVSLSPAPDFVSYSGRNQWHSYSFSFVASSTATNLKFTDNVSTQVGLDSFLDKIVVTASVPEPSRAVLLGLASLGLILRRRR